MHCRSLEPIPRSESPGGLIDSNDSSGALHSFLAQNTSCVYEMQVGAVLAAFVILTAAFSKAPILAKGLFFSARNKNTKLYG